MSAFDYTRTRATAERLIARFGQAGIIRRMVKSGPEWDPTIEPTDYPCTLVEAEFSIGMVNGSTVLSSDKRMYVSTQGLAIEPTITDQVVIGTDVLTIVPATSGGFGVQPLKPAGTVVLYDIHCRK